MTRFTVKKRNILSCGVFVFVIILCYLIHNTSTLNDVYAQSAEAEGYYKDIFIDGGVNLSSYGCSEIYVVNALGLSCDAYEGENEVEQNDLIVTNTLDTNGILLYPDGNPRFRMVYINGGRSSLHGESLTQAGRDNFKNFFDNGGSYSGSCAGAFISCNHYNSPTNEYYFHLCPIYTVWTGMENTTTDMAIPSDSALLNYNNFGGDFIIPNVYHNGGGYANNTPSGTGILATYLNSPIARPEGKPAVWSWKDPNDTNKGRLVVTGSHPERVNNGERLELMKAMFQYALDGVGNKRPVTATLQPGVTNNMTAATEKIGDKQYHYFRFTVPSGSENMQIDLISTEKDEDLDLYASYDSKPDRLSGNYQYSDVGSGPDESIFITNPTEGLWYIGVYGNHSVYNGVPYSITATLEAVEPECGNSTVESGEECDPPGDINQCDHGACSNVCSCPEPQPINDMYDLNEDEKIDNEDFPIFLDNIYKTNFSVGDFNVDAVVNNIDYGMLLNAIENEFVPGNLTLYTTLNGISSVTEPIVGTGGQVVDATFTNGKEGNALLVDDTGEYARFPMTGNVNATEGTVEFWYKNTGNTSDYGRFFADSRVTMPEHVYFGLWRGASDTVIRFLTDGSDNRVEWSGIPNVFDGQWHFMRLTYNVSTNEFELYIDSVSQGKQSSAVNMNPINTNYDIAIGNNSLGERQIGGIIDELKVYNAEITQ